MKPSVKGAGASVSLPDVSPLRFECEQGSDLPWHLSRCGYEVRSVGTNERLMPVTETVKLNGGNTVTTRQHVAPCRVAVFLLQLTPVDDIIP
jgi:hypothetical protein